MNINHIDLDSREKIEADIQDFISSSPITNYSLVQVDYWRILKWLDRQAMITDQELIDLAHNAWSMALCAMNGMPIPAEWGDAVERGLRKHGIDVDGELAAFEVIC